MSKKLSGGQLAGGNSAYDKADNDLYTTDENSVRLFLDKFKQDGYNLEGVIWENAVGLGSISNTIKEYYPNNKIIETDLIDRGIGKGNIDFLNHNFKEFKADTIITNPPFSLLNDFISRGLELTNKYLIYFAKIQTLEGVNRIAILENSPLKYVYIHKNRQNTYRNNERLNPVTGKKWSTTTVMCWFVWDKEYNGEPIIRWI